jgi:hypothetical protein
LRGRVWQGNGGKGMTGFGMGQALGTEIQAVRGATEHKREQGPLFPLRVISSLTLRVFARFGFLGPSSGFLGTSSGLGSSGGHWQGVGGLEESVGAGVAVNFSPETTFSDTYSPK